MQKPLIFSGFCFLTLCRLLVDFPQFYPYFCKNFYRERGDNIFNCY